MATCGVASSQPPRSALLGVGVEHVQSDVPSAGGRLRSKRDASIVQPTRSGDIGSGGTSQYRRCDVQLGGLLFLSWRSSTCRKRVSGESRRPLAAEPERLTCVLTIDCDHLGERTASAAYFLTLKVSYDCRPAPQHVMSWHLGQIGRGAPRACGVAGTPMMVAYGPADHAYEVAASAEPAEGPVGRGGRSRPIASFGLFRAITLTRKGLNNVFQ